VARAATAFNAMQRRIADQIAERIQILAAISHDLQTPITRMRCAPIFWRTLVQRKSFRATCRKCRRSSNRVCPGAGTRPRRRAAFQTDLYALVDSLVCDYSTPEKHLRLVGERG